MKWVAPSMGAVLANVMFFSPLMVVLKKRKLAQPLGKLNPLPYPIIFVNCINWLLYAFVTRDPFLFFANAPGLMMGLFFTISSLPLADPATRLRIELLLYILLGADLLVSGVAFVVNDDKDTRQLILGLFGNLVLLVYYAAPLSSLWEVVQKRNSASLYWPMALANCANGFCWTVYGIVRNDWFLIIPNSIGSILGLVQLVFRLLFTAESDEDDRLPTAHHTILKTSASAATLVEFGEFGGKGGEFRDNGGDSTPSGAGEKTVDASDQINGNYSINPTYDS
eukprot:CAMPEP_0198203894 /NCGR_PEP_ID=MMETSP1445-20131203/7228_1 /TAXON_ID=36898 /ORGANISM="Pyramimonas sp., Strain CCMP2087" /LENGTH=280 /DNA_ID=CAMNT_0043875479 /DNA_START=102 /DNA_END=944 /DNA_ORIENTATION=+